MPEQLTKHPEVTLDVLRSAGARCGAGAPQEILKQCPPERFCKLPGGELCVYGLPQAQQMTQVSRAEWQSVLGGTPGPAAVAPPAAPPAATGDTTLVAGGIGLLAGFVLAALLLRRRARAP